MIVLDHDTLAPRRPAPLAATSLLLGSAAAASWWASTRPTPCRAWRWAWSKLVVMPFDMATAAYFGIWAAMMAAIARRLGARGALGADRLAFDHKDWRLEQ
jgi:hypothetical protein